MSLEERKQKFIKLLEDLIEEKGGVKRKLAEELKISRSRLSHWLQGKTDPAGLDILIFNQLARVKGCSIDQLVQILGFITIEDLSQVRFRDLLEELLLDKTQKELAERLGIDPTTISKWLNLEQKVDWGKISAKTMFSLSMEKNWTLEKLFNYLKLEPNNEINSKRFLNYFHNNFTVIIILEKEDLTVASLYLSNLTIHLKISPDNIMLVTIAQFKEVKRSFDLLIFDITTKAASKSELISQISFDGDIVIFTAEDLEKEVRSQLEDKVTDIVVKPLDWKSLKDKPYFARI